MKKIRIKRSVLNIFVVIAIGVLAALCLDRMGIPCIVVPGFSFSTLTDEHVELIVDMIKKTGYATFRCADAKMYEEAYEKFVLEDVIHFNIGFDTKIKYSVNKNVRTL